MTMHGARFDGALSQSLPLPWLQGLTIQGGVKQMAREISLYCAASTVSIMRIVIHGVLQIYCFKVLPRWPLLIKGFTN